MLTPLEKHVNTVTFIRKLFCKIARKIAKNNKKIEVHDTLQFKRLNYAILSYSHVYLLYL